MVRTIRSSKGRRGFVLAVIVLNKPLCKPTTTAGLLSIMTFNCWVLVKTGVENTAEKWDEFIHPGEYCSCFNEIAVFLQSKLHSEPRNMYGILRHHTPLFQYGLHSGTCQRSKSHNAIQEVAATNVHIENSHHPWNYDKMYRSQNTCSVLKRSKGLLALNWGVHWGK